MYGVDLWGRVGGSDWLLRNADSESSRGRRIPQFDDKGRQLGVEVQDASRPRVVSEVVYRKIQVSNTFTRWCVVLYWSRHGFGVKGEYTRHEANGTIRDRREREWVSDALDRALAEMKYDFACQELEGQGYERQAKTPISNEETVYGLDPRAIEGRLYILSDYEKGTYLPVTYPVVGIRFVGVSECSFSVWLSDDVKDVESLKTYMRAVYRALRSGDWRVIVESLEGQCVEVHVSSIYCPGSKRKDEGFLLRQGSGVGDFEGVVLQIASDREQVQRLDRAQVLRKVLYRKRRRRLEV